MATLRQTWALGPGNAGILSDLRLRFLNDAGTPVGSVITTGFFERGVTGQFAWAGDKPSDDFEGFLELYRLSTGEVFPLISLSELDTTAGFLVGNGASSVAVALQAQGLARPVQAHVYIGQYDLLPIMRVQLLDENSLPVDLTTADSAEFIIQRGTDTPVRLTAVIEGGDDGWLNYPWEAGDTDTAGNYRMQIPVVWSAGVQQTWPNDTSYIQLHITRALAEPEE